MSDRTYFAVIMAALEQACRSMYNQPQSILGGEFVECDKAAVRYGPSTAAISRCAGVGISMADVRSTLNAVGADEVLRHQSRDRGQIRWWPVGLFGKLQAEKGGAK